MEQSKSKSERIWGGCEMCNDLNITEHPRFHHPGRVAIKFDCLSKWCGSCQLIKAITESFSKESGEVGLLNLLVDSHGAVVIRWNVNKSNAPPSDYEVALYASEPVRKTLANRV